MKNDILISFTDGKVIKLLGQEILAYDLCHQLNTMVHVITRDGSMFIPWKNIRYIEIRRPEP